MLLATVGNVLADPWRDPLTRRALAEAVLLAIAGGTIGCWIVFYNLAYSAESLAHALLPGLVVAALTGLPLLLGGAAGLVVAALGVALAARVPAIGRDTGVAVVVTTLFGLGALLALSSASPPGLQGLLFGDILGVSNTDLALAGGLVVVVLGALGALHGRLVLVGFDRGNARALGVSPTLVDAALLLLVAVVLLVAVQGLGNLLVVAVLIAPAAGARLLTRRIAPMMAAGAGIAVAGVVGGLYLSFYAGTASGASIAAVLVGLYALVGASCALRGRARSRPQSAQEP